MVSHAADLEHVRPDGTHDGTTAFLVPTGTRIRIISAGLDKRQVEIAEGEHKGRRGWIPLDWLQK